jgi:aryl-alcohol dehydrogenase-like predicted oxidoreductase
MSHSKIVLGLWPIAGITTVGVTPQEARATLQAAIDGGVTTFDTAYSYGYDGESDRLLGEFVADQGAGRRDHFTVLAKVGQRWDARRRRVIDGSPKQLIADAHETLRRMKLDCVDVLFLHSPDPDTPLQESAAAMQDLQTAGVCKRIGICNVSAEQLDTFAGSVPTDALQCPLNMIQRDSQTELIDPSRAAGRRVYVFWVLMKGLLAGKIGREHVFRSGDSRPGYAIFQGQLRRSIHDTIDQLRLLGAECGQTVAQLAVGWAISQPGVTGALVGARRPDQIQETLAAGELSAETLARIDNIVAGCLATRSPDR